MQTRVLHYFFRHTSHLLWELYRFLAQYTGNSTLMWINFECTLTTVYSAHTPDGYNILMVTTVVNDGVTNSLCNLFCTTSKL